VDELHLPARCLAVVALDWVIIFFSSAVLISGYVLRVLLTSVGQSRDGSQRNANEKKSANVGLMVFLVSSDGAFLPHDSGAIPRPSEMRWNRLTLRVPPLHLIEFLGRDLRQVPDEQNQAPGLRVSVRSVEGWHAAQTNSIFNGVVELTIALVLRPG
jgi:hypothetical protein